jgi:hypothetical protein
LCGTKAWAKCHGIPSHQLLNVASHMPSSNEQSSAIRRPWYLTVVAAVLLLWGAGMSCYFLPGTVKALLSGVAPLGIPLLFLAWMHVLWVVLTVVGIGILRGDARARPLLVVGLVAMIAAPALSGLEAAQGIISKLIVYALLIWAVFTRGSSIYFAHRNAEAVHRHQADPQ